jgi:hypothetical protein
MDQSRTRLRRSFSPTSCRPRRGFRPAGRPLEGRQLLSAAATMTQTATFPDLESHPTVSDQALLYFGATMGTLTEVDVVTSGSFTSRFSAENLGDSGNSITGTTAANLAISVPTGAVPMTIPAVSRSFNASPFDGQLDDGGTSGQTFAPVTSSSMPQTEVLTSPADLAAFTGHFRIPFGVSGHATGSVASSHGEVSGAFQTDTSATITVVYHYIPNLPGLDPPAGSPTASARGGTGAAPTRSTGVHRVHAASARSHASSGRADRDGPRGIGTSPDPQPFRRHTARQPGPSRRRGPDPGSGS